MFLCLYICGQNKNRTEMMEKMDKEMLEQVLRIFMRYGIKSMTMDDVSRELKISKKTLYKYVTDKADLVTKVLQFECDSDHEMVEKFAAESDSAIEELLRITHHIGEKVSAVHPSIHFDLEKYYPEAWEVFSNYKKNTAYRTVLANLKRGIREGYYRKDLNPEIMTRIHISRIDIVFDGELFPPSLFHFGDVFREMMTYHIHGIANEKGIELLKQKLKNDQIIKLSH